MKEVFVVTKGRYSEYHIEAVCSTREMAERFVRCLGGEYEDDWDKANIETYTLDEMVEFYDDEFYCYTVEYIPADNRIIAIRKEFLHEPPHLMGGGVTFIFSLPPESRAIQSYFESGNTDLLMKVIHDTYAQYKAENLGL